MLIIGIDPGVQGGMAIIPLYAFKQTQVFSFTEHTLFDIVHLFREIRYGSEGPDGKYRKDTPVEVFLENPRMPATNQHTGKNFNLSAHQVLGRSVGQLEGICIAHDWQPNLISPQKWQNGLDCKTGGDKNVSKDKAQEIFHFLYRRSADGTPHTLITHYVADALLIGLYGYLHYATHVPNTVKQNVPAKQLAKFKTRPVPTNPNIDTVLKETTHERRKPVPFRSRGSPRVPP